MTNLVLSVNNLTKHYDLGIISTGTLSHDLNRWWTRLCHQPDPELQIAVDVWHTGDLHSLDHP